MAAPSCECEHSLGLHIASFLCGLLRSGLLGGAFRGCRLFSGFLHRRSVCRCSGRLLCGRIGFRRFVCRVFLYMLFSRFFRLFRERFAHLIVVVLFPVSMVLLIEVDKLFEERITLAIGTGAVLDREQLQLRMPSRLMPSGLSRLPSP